MNSDMFPLQVISQPGNLKKPKVELLTNKKTKDERIRSKYQDLHCQGISVYVEILWNILNRNPAHCSHTQIHNGDGEGRRHQPVLERVLYGFNPGEKDSIHSSNDPCQANVRPALLSH